MYKEGNNKDKKINEIENKLNGKLVNQKLVLSALTGVAQLVGCCPLKQGVAGLFQARAHTWVVGLVLGWGAVNQFLSFLCPSLPFSLKINK